MEKSKWYEANKKKVAAVIFKLDEHIVKGLDENQLGLPDVKRVILGLEQEIKNLLFEVTTLKEAKQKLEDRIANALA